MADLEQEVKTIAAADFAALDQKAITVVDVREKDEVLVHPIEGAYNVPFSSFPNGLDEIPNDKPVYVICRTGDWSEQVAEILADRGYDAANVAGGFAALRALEQQNTAAAPAKAEENAPESADPIFVDAKNLKCPGPIVKVADTLRKLPDGAVVNVEATEDAFASDIAVWCERTGNKLLSLDTKPQFIKAAVQKSEARKEAPQSAGNDKNFVVFSGDLDKTIAAFIMANGAASMGRNVSMFFTFWGLNILRKPKKVPVHKTVIEKMFGFMMPRGTKQLGLSRMNMGGMGAKMIRAIMKQKGISSLEELIQDAIAHGVRIVACQMSMDIMGIHKEELIDGVELGGVATFLGAGETSDMSLFI